MNLRTLAVGVSLSLGLIGAHARAQEAPAVSWMDQPRDWGATLRTDAAGFHAEILNSHPGPVDPLNPAFRGRLDAGLETALARADTVSDAGGWWWAMRAFVASFDDGHVQIGLKDQGGGFPTRWPGFLTVRRGADHVVADRIEGDEAAPPLGARLIDCDGVPADRLAEERIGQFRGRWFLESQRVIFSDWLFLNASNPWIGEMRACRFESGGRTENHDLNWRAIDSGDLATRRTALAAGGRPAFGMKVLEDGGYWLSMPSFDGTPGGEAHTALTAMLAEAEAAAPALRAAPWIVLDLRGNGGGSSHWSGRLTNILWGREWRLAHQAPQSEGVDWRASEANIADMATFLDQLKASNGAADLMEWAETAVTGMREARAAGRPYWFAANDPAPVAAPAAPPVNPVTARVYVLTDPGCASACLDAVDLWKPMGAVQIGRETSADTVYMEVRQGELPSGLAAIGVPMKVYRGRARGNNEPHQPAHVFGGDMRDDSALQAWVRTLN